MTNIWLFAAGILDALAAIAHLGCVVFGPPWYRFFGAGQHMVRLAEHGSPKPALLTFAIAATLCVWSAYAFSGAALITTLPLLRPVLIAISVVYLARAAALPLMLRFMQQPGRSARFLVVSSAIVLILGIVHAIGTAGLWS